VDGDLFGLHPEHLVPDSFTSFDAFFDTPNDVGTCFVWVLLRCLCLCVSVSVCSMLCRVMQALVVLYICTAYLIICT
jgi:hypothetical protein